MATDTEVTFAKCLEELNALSRRDVAQGIKLAKYKKTAQAMLKKDPVVGNTLLGLVACLQHDLPAMHACHRSAIDSCESCFSLMYYGLSLEKACLWSDSVRFYLLALDYEPDNLQVLRSAITLAPLTGRFSLLKRLTPQLSRAGSGVPGPGGHPELVVELLSEHGVQEKDLKEVLSVISEAFCGTDLILQGFRYHVVRAGDKNAFLHYRFLIPDQFVATYYEDLVAAKLAKTSHHPRCFDAFSFSVENSTLHELYEYMENELNGSADLICIPDLEKMKLIEELVAGVEI